MTLNIQKKADLALIIVVMFWGTSNLLTKVGLGDLSEFNLIALRFVLAFGLTAVAFRKRLAAVDFNTVKRAAILSVILLFVYIFATFGVRYTTVSNAGFLTCLSGIIVPLINYVVFRIKLDKMTVVSIAMALAGVWLLIAGTSITFNLGDILCILCSVAFAVHILVTERFTKEVDGLRRDSVGIRRRFRHVFQLFARNPHASGVLFKLDGHTGTQRLFDRNCIRHTDRCPEIHNGNTYRTDLYLRAAFLRTHSLCVSGGSPVAQGLCRSGTDAGEPALDRTEARFKKGGFLMMPWTMIFAVDLDWNIGYDGDMLFKIHADLRRFRRMTESNLIIMGRKTFESLPEQRPLPNRVNIVVTRDRGYQREGVTVVHDLESLIVLVDSLTLDSGDSLKPFLIGGGELARQCLPWCGRALITKVFRQFDADTLIPNLDEDSDWAPVWSSRRYQQDDLIYQYVNYERISGA